MEYRCYHCKQVFTNEALAAEHFGHSTESLPLCIVYGRTGQGGGPHDPWIRILRSELVKAENDMILVRQLIEGWRNICSDEEWGQFEQDTIASAQRVHQLLVKVSRDTLAGKR